MSDFKQAADNAERKKYDWLRAEAGDCIDALDAALNGFSPRNLDSLIALRRQVRVILERTRSLDLAALAAAAEHALDAGALDIRMSVETLLVLMRKAAHVGRSHAAQPAERDKETGLLNAGAFLQRLARIETDRHTHAAVAAIHIADAADLRKRHGDAVAPLLLNHVATILSDQLREGDTIARMNDFEFAILLPMEDSEGLQAALSRIESVVLRSPAKFPDGTSTPVRISSSGFQLGRNGHTNEPAPSGFNSQTIVGSLAGDPAKPGATAAYTIGIAVQNETTAAVIGSLLERSGYRTVIAGAKNGTDRFAPLAGCKLHLLVIDEARDTLSPARRALTGRRLPVVVLADDADTAQWALENGARESLQKPVRTELLLDCIKRLVLRGRAGDGAMKRSPHKGVHIASDDVSQLIALGSALQKQGGMHISLGRGADDAIDQIRRHEPAAVIVHMPLARDETRKLLAALADTKPVPSIVLIINADEEHIAARLKIPTIAGILHRPVILRTLHTEVQRIAGRVSSSTPEIAHEIMRGELLRVMRTAIVPPPA